ncbi:MAG TPA: glycosyl hydrolase family 65 protein [Phycisphaerae bacterium]|nr:glycosyl hydrolase family 65 protein [Phycisphaerae bacterium]
MKRCGPAVAFGVYLAVIGVAAPTKAPAAAPAPAPPAGPAEKHVVLTTEDLDRYVDQFNGYDEEHIVNHVPNAAAKAFLRKNVPLLDCPDADLEEIYYFRWWTYRKHVKQTPDGFVITEFLPQVTWSGKHNTISCPAGHHFYEGRWLHDPTFLDDYAVFWFRKGGQPRRYSFWAADALYARHLVRPDKALITSLLDDLVANYRAWETSRLGPEGLFWQIDDRDGMEVSIGGSGYRATINSYMYGDAVAIARIAQMAGRTDLVKEYEAKAARIKHLVQTRLWDPKAEFFKVLPRDKGGKVAETPADVRELHGYTPWYVGLPDPAQAVAWRQLMDPKGFYAPFGPTTAEQRHPRFAVSYKGHECQWNGPSWPYATSVTLTALANLLNGPPQDHIGAKDYFDLLKIYAKSHRLRRDDGRIVPWIDENLNPHTGDWISRTRLKTWKNGTWDRGKGGRERGKDYNHSTFCDLVITGLVGLRPRDDNRVEVNPLVPPETWDWFCLDAVAYHGRALTILWDKTGTRYAKGSGLRVFCDGRPIAHAPRLERVRGTLP